MTTRPSASLRRLTVIASALAAIALVVPQSGASAVNGSGFGLRVFTGDNPAAAVFHSANCVVIKKTFSAVANLDGWKVAVQIHPFRGFSHRYALVRGYFNGTFMSVSHGGQAEYASDFVPPHHIPSGGEINFSDHGKLMGGGFYPMFNGAGNDAVGVAGRLTCHYPKTRPR